MENKLISIELFKDLRVDGKDLYFGDTKVVGYEHTEGKEIPSLYNIRNKMKVADRTDLVFVTGLDLIEGGFIWLGPIDLEVSFGHADIPETFHKKFSNIKRLLDGSPHDNWVITIESF
ncbi:MAG: hypothetical protein ACXACY_19210 [Candidatus Hodarchaeales archaeon]|jgi:hypothetical protein